MCLSGSLLENIIKWKNWLCFRRIRHPRLYITILHVKFPITSNFLYNRLSISHSQGIAVQIHSLSGFGMAFAPHTTCETLLSPSATRRFLIPLTIFSGPSNKTSLLCLLLSGGYYSGTRMLFINDCFIVWDDSVSPGSSKVVVTKKTRSSPLSRLL